MEKTLEKEPSNGGARISHLEFLEKLDKVDLAMRGTNDIGQMISNVLEVMVPVFDCDRAWLVYPCDPKSDSWKTAILRTKPEYAIPQGVELPMDSESVRIINAVLASSVPVAFGPGSEPPPQWPHESFNIKSQLSLALYPKIDKPYMLGMHQCSSPRIWTNDEKDLFEEIGRRLTDTLVSLLMYQNLQKSEEKYRRIIETSNEGIWVVDREESTVFVNPRMLAIIGRKEEEVIGKKLKEFIILEELQDHDLKMEERRSGKPGLYERRLIKNNGEIIWVSVSASPLVDQKGEFDGSLAMMTDITEKKKTEEKMHEVNDMRAKFLTIISHQLRTPLTVVNWNLEMILGGDLGKLDTIKQNFLQGTYEASVRMTNRIDDLIAAMDIEEGRINLIKEDVLLDSICSEIMNMVMKRCETKGISCSYKAPQQEIPAIKGDSGKIRASIARLMENAVEYTKSGGKVSAELSAKNGIIRFEVSDNGIGIPMAEQHRVFGKFFRASNAFTMQPDAFGLGLYVTKSFIESHGGIVGFKSEEGKGSNFWFEIPVGK